MQKLRTIGEIAKMTNIPVRTLHYYDEIGLFKPVFVDRKTNYRYYSESQLHTLDLIKSLKYIGTPLEEIKFAQHLTTEELLAFLAEQQVKVADRVRRMQEVEETLLRTMKQLEEQIDIPVLEEVYEMNIEAQRLLAIRSVDATVEHIPDRYFRSITETAEREGTVMNSRYGGILPLKNYKSIKEIYYDYVYTPLLTNRYLEHLNADVEVLVMPKGRYLCVAFYYKVETYISNYKILYDAIEQKGVEVCSPIYEVFMPTNFAPNEEPQYIVEMKIKLC